MFRELGFGLPLDAGDELPAACAHCRDRCGLQIAPSLCLRIPDFCIATRFSLMLLFHLTFGGVNLAVNSFRKTP